MLIEIELRDVSAAEREHWMTLLGSVDVDQVPYLLNARRKAALAHSPPAASTPAATADTAEAGGIHRLHAEQTRGVDSNDPAVVSPPVTTLPVAAGAATGVLRTEGSLQEADPESSSTAGTPSPPRRWMAPLRSRWGEGRGEQGTAPVQTVSAATNLNEPSPEPTLGTTARSSAYMNVELQRVMTVVRTELEQTRAAGGAASGDDYRRLQIQMRLLQLLADEPEQALQAIPELPSEQQEFWIQMLWTLANELDPPAGVSESQRLERTAELLRSAETQMRRAAPLSIRNTCFCHRINSFGSYERFARDEFRPGQPVLLYCEVANFHSELSRDSVYTTRLRTAVEILPVDATGQPPAGAHPVDRREFPATEDVCRSLRSDYFHSYRLDLPSQLAPGSYLLRIGIVDELGGKTASTEVPFAIR